MTVEVRREGDRWLATVGGRRHEVSVTEVGGRWSLLIGRRSYEIAFEGRRGGEFVVHVNGRAVPVALAAAFAKRRREAAGGGASGPVAVTAPMPGRIVKVLVRKGDVVDARRGLIVVEAMKMENELRAPRPGTVADVRVSEGMSVEAGAVLVIIE